MAPCCQLCLFSVWEVRGCKAFRAGRAAPSVWEAQGCEAFREGLSRAWPVESRPSACKGGKAHWPRCERKFKRSGSGGPGDRHRSLIHTYIHISLSLSLYLSLLLRTSDWEAMRLRGFRGRSWRLAVSCVCFRFGRSEAARLSGQVVWRLRFGRRKAARLSGKVCRAHGMWNLAFRRVREGKRTGRGASASSDARPTAVETAAGVWVASSKVVGRACESVSGPKTKQKGKYTLLPFYLCVDLPQAGDPWR